MDTAAKTSPARVILDSTYMDTAAVDSFAAASAAVRGYLEANGMGSSDWTGRNSGSVLNSFGEKIAKVSYNGRVWDLSGKEIEIGGVS